LDHSWNLLDGEEKSVLRRLSVFVGSFDREAAEKICAANLSTLSSLKDKSLLRRSVRGRFELHELIRQYAALRLSEDAGEDERVRDQHAIYYAQRLADWEAALKGARQAETLDEMAMEIDNLRQAWQRLVSCCDFDCHENTFFHPSLFRSSLFSLSLFFELRCRYWEAVQVFGKAVETLKAAKASATRLEDGASLDPFLGLVTAYLGHHQYLMHFVQAGETLEEALRLLEDDPSRVGKAQAQIIFAWLYQAQGLYHQAEELFQKSSLVFQEEGDEWWYTLTLSMLAWATLGKGYIEESVPLFLETLNRIEPGDLRLGSHTRTGLGYARFFQGDYPEAERLLTESLELNRRLENKRQEAYNQRLLGQVALAEGQREQAQKRFQECVDLLAVYGESPDLAIGLVYLGKGLSACSELEAAREKFQQAVQIGRGFQIFYLVYWGLVNLARISMVEGQIEKAVEMAAVLGKYSVESKVVQDDQARLLEELKARLSPQQIEAAISQARERSIESLLDQAPTS
jgi:tetratricopeptide (TPR) repeat protein